MKALRAQVSILLILTQLSSVVVPALADGEKSRAQVLMAEYELVLEGARQEFGEAAATGKPARLEQSASLLAILGDSAKGVLSDAQYEEVQLSRYRMNLASKAAPFLQGLSCDPQSLEMLQSVLFNPGSNLSACTPSQSEKPEAALFSEAQELNVKALGEVLAKTGRADVLSRIHRPIDFVKSNQKGAKDKLARAGLEALLGQLALVYAQVRAQNSVVGESNLLNELTEKWGIPSSIWGDRPELREQLVQKYRSGPKNQKALEEGQRKALARFNEFQKRIRDMNQKGDQISEQAEFLVDLSKKLNTPGGLGHLPEVIFTSPAEALQLNPHLIQPQQPLEGSIGPGVVLKNGNVVLPVLNPPAWAPLMGYQSPDLILATQQKTASVEALSDPNGAAAMAAAHFELAQESAEPSGWSGFVKSPRWKSWSEPARREQLKKEKWDGLALDQQIEWESKVYRNLEQSYGKGLAQWSQERFYQSAQKLKGLDPTLQETLGAVALEMGSGPSSRATGVPSGTLIQAQSEVAGRYFEIEGQIATIQQEQLGQFPVIAANAALQNSGNSVTLEFYQQNLRRWLLQAEGLMKELSAKLARLSSNPSDVEIRSVLSVTLRNADVMAGVTYDHPELLPVACSALKDYGKRDGDQESFDAYANLVTGTIATGAGFFGGPVGVVGSLALNGSMSVYNWYRTRGRIQSLEERQKLAQGVQGALGGGVSGARNEGMLELKEQLEQEKKAQFFNYFGVGAAGLGATASVARGASNVASAIRVANTGAGAAGLGLAVKGASDGLESLNQLSQAISEFEARYGTDFSKMNPVQAEQYRALRSQKSQALFLTTASSILMTADAMQTHGLHLGRDSNPKANRGHASVLDSELASKLRLAGETIIEFSDNGRKAWVKSRRDGSVLLEVDPSQLPIKNKDARRSLEALLRKARMDQVAGVELLSDPVEQVYSILKVRYGDKAAEEWLGFARKGIKGMKELGVSEPCTQGFLRGAA